MSWIPRIKYSFFGRTLETGSKIVAVTHLLIYSFCFMVVYFYYSILIHNHLQRSDDGNATALEDGTEPSNSTHLSDFKPLDIQSTFFQEESAFAQFTFACLLLYGLKKKNPDLLFSWVLLQIALVFHAQLIILLNVILALHINPGHVLYYMVEEVIIAFLELYCMVVVYNYSLNLRSHHTSTSPSNQYF